MGSIRAGGLPVGGADAGLSGGRDGGTGHHRGRHGCGSRSDAGRRAIDDRARQPLEFFDRNVLQSRSPRGRLIGHRGGRSRRDRRSGNAGFFRLRFGNRGRGRRRRRSILRSGSRRDHLLRRSEAGTTTAATTITAGHSAHHAAVEATATAAGVHAVGRAINRVGIHAAAAVTAATTFFRTVTSGEFRQATAATREISPVRTAFVDAGIHAAATDGTQEDDAT